MPTESDRDELARIIYTATKNAHWQEWEKSSDGIRNWCRAKADEAMAAGWRKVGADQVVVRRATTKMCQTVLQVAAKSRASYMRDQVTNALADVTAALADPAGANGGE